MPEFSVNPHRHDPYKNFRFRVKFTDSGDDIVGISKVGGLKRMTEVIEHREGADLNMPRKSPGRTTFAPIILERGVTHDVAFEQWANKVWTLSDKPGSGPDVSLKDFRKDLIIELHNEAGQPVLRYFVHRCWVSEYQALPELDASSNTVAIQWIKIEHEGWERDLNLAEPTETAFTIPPA